MTSLCTFLLLFPLFQSHYHLPIQHLLLYSLFDFPLFPLFRATQTSSLTHTPLCSPFHIYSSSRYLHPIMSPIQANQYHPRGPILVFFIYSSLFFIIYLLNNSMALINAFTYVLLYNLLYSSCFTSSYLSSHLFTNLLFVIYIFFSLLIFPHLIISPLHILFATHCPSYLLYLSFYSQPSFGLHT